MTPRRDDTVGHVELREHLREILGRLGDDRPVSVTNRNRVEAYLVSPSEFERLARADEQLDRLRATLPMLVAALQAQVAYPAEALRSLIGSDLSIDWRLMNAFQASLPTEPTHDEDGRPLTSPPRAPRHQPLEESDEELIYG